MTKGLKKQEGLKERKGLKKRDVMLLKDLVEDKIKRTLWVLKNKSKKDIQDPNQLKENLEGYRELLRRVNESLT